AHHVLISHGEAMPVIRANTPPETLAGITLNLYYVSPAGISEKDQLAAQYQDGYANRWFLDPVYKGHYPADMVELFGANLDGIDLSAVRVACAPTDFLRINYYSRNVVTYDESNPLKTKAINPEGSAYTDM